MAIGRLTVAWPSNPALRLFARLRGHVTDDGEIKDLQGAATIRLHLAYAKEAVRCCYRPGEELRRRRAEIEIYVGIGDIPKGCVVKPYWDAAIQSLGPEGLAAR